MIRRKKKRFERGEGRDGEGGGENQVANETGV